MKRCFLIVLSVLMLVCIIPAFASAEMIKFGTYPQGHVTDAALIEKLDSMDKIWSAYDPSGTDSFYDGMYFSDFFYEGQKYRAVVKNQFWGHLYDAYPPLKIHYFKYAPIDWEVLDENSGYVMSSFIIDVQSYQSSVYINGEYWHDSTMSSYANNYSVSTIRDWLNYDFYETAFTDTQKAAIKKTQLNNDAVPEWPEYNAPSTKDKIFLLSVADATNTAYGFSSNHAASYTGYSEWSGMPTFGMWWLRSPSAPGECGTAAALDGIAYMPVYQGNGIRPACVLNHLVSDTTISNSLFSEQSGVDSTHIHRFIQSNRVEATCAKTGNIFYDCSCGKIKTKTIPATNNHTMGEPVETAVTTPTCGAEGTRKITIKCNVCGKTLSETIESIPATGNHTGGRPAETVLTAPTCGAAGEKKLTVTCTVCNALLSETTAPIAPTGEHTAGEPVETVLTSPDCLNEGEKKITVTCSVCGEVLSENTAEIPAVGHTLSSPVETVIQTPSCTKTGEKTVATTCTACGEEFVSQVSIPKLPHTDADKDGSCDVCGAAVCRYCGKTHSGPIGGLTQFFHNLIYFFKNLFGKG